MKHKPRQILVVVLILTLASLACASLTGGNPSVPTAPAVATVNIEPVEEATATQPPAPTALPDLPESTPAGGGNTTGQNAGSDSISLSDPAIYTQPAGINTYRTSLVFTFSGQAEDGTPVTGSITGEGQYSVDPNQISFTFQTSNSDIPIGTMEVVQMDDTLYMSSSELGCFSLPIDAGPAENPYQELLDTGGFLTGEAARIQPDETINGIPTYVYEITNANLKPGDTATQEVTEITTGRIYLAQDGGYVVRLLIDGRGKNTILTDQIDLVGEVHYEITYFDQNQPVDIAPPENCSGTTPGGGDTGLGGSDYPIPEGAENVVNLAGIVSYSASQTVEELAEYYKTEMAAAGWTLSNELNAPGTSSLMFTKDSVLISIIIASDPSTGKTLVTIFEG